jgi:hypothetical protein
MPDRRTIKIVISTIGVGDNFETMENDGDAQSEVFDVIVDDHVSLYRALIRCKRLIEAADFDAAVAHKHLYAM